MAIATDMIARGMAQQNSVQVAENTNQIADLSANKADQIDLDTTNAILEEKADKTNTANLQQQINNLVLGASGTNITEVVQSRGIYAVLSDKLTNYDTLMSLKDLFTTVKNMSFVNGKYVGITLTGSSWHQCFAEDCEYGNYFIINAQHASGGSLNFIQFTNASNEIISTIAGTTTATIYENYIVAVPVGATKIYVTVDNSYARTAFKYTYTKTLKSILDSIETNLDNLKVQVEDNTEWLSGYYKTDSISLVTDGYLHSKKISCAVGDIFIVSAKVNDFVNPFILFDTNNNFIKTYKPLGTAIYTDEVIEIETNGFLCINSYEYETYGLVKKKIGFNANAMEQRVFNLEQDIYSQDRVLCVGDSQTQRVGYAQRLSSDITDGTPVYSFGQGGANSVDIGYFQGGIPIYTQPFTIPSDTSSVPITLFSDVVDSIGDVTALGIQSTQGLNPVTIGGIKGNISATYNPDYSNKQYFFNRLTAGSSVVINRPCRIITKGMEYKNSILVVWAGTNDSYQKQDNEVDSVTNNIVKPVHDIINYNGTNKYIVVGLTSKAYMNSVSKVNLNLAKEFGHHFLDIRKYILNYGLQDAGITPTSQDTTDISNVEIPTSLRADSVHFNSAGYNIIGDLIYKKGIELGYWN